MKHNTWITILSVVSLSMLSLGSGSTQAAQATGNEFTVADFRLHTAQELVDVCTAKVGDEHYEMAIAFCYGFFEGAVHYDEAISGLEWYRDMICPPPEASRQQAVSVFIAYLRDHPDYASDQPVDVIFRSLVDKWPCEK